MFPVQRIVPWPRNWSITWSDSVSYYESRCSVCIFYFGAHSSINTYGTIKFEKQRFSLNRVKSDNESDKAGLKVPWPMSATSKRTYETMSRLLSVQYSTWANECCEGSREKYIIGAVQNSTLPGFGWGVGLLPNCTAAKTHSMASWNSLIQTHGFM